MLRVFVSVLFSQDAMAVLFMPPWLQLCASSVATPLRDVMESLMCCVLECCDCVERPTGAPLESRNSSDVPDVVSDITAARC